MNYSLYFHIPFCIHRCAYCDFNTYAGQEALIPAYVEALCREIESVGAKFPSTFEAGKRKADFHTVFFGGGTPSLLTPKQFDQILQTIRSSFNPISSDISEPSDACDSSNFPPEISLEANPGTVTLASLQALRRAGFNRISFGVQSFDPGELNRLERIHDPFDILNAVSWARQAGFENINLDLIYGLPEQSLARWQANVQRAVELAPEHLSLYALTIEHGTPYGRWAARGLLPLPDPDLAADMYEAASEFLEGHGYEQYEISNWARPGFQCRHNLQYWRNGPYLGFGGGAHGCSNGMRISNVMRIKTYLNRFAPDAMVLDQPFPLSPATVSETRLTPYVEMQETMMLGLRLTQEGVSAQAFRRRFGQEMHSVFGKEIDELVGLGLLEWIHSPLPLVTTYLPPSEEVSGMMVRLTKHGRLLGNQAFMRFVGD